MTRTADHLAALRLGLRYVTETGERAPSPDEATHCRFVHQWDTDTEWHAFGGLVPVVLSGALAGSHVRAVYHLALLAEMGCSATLDALLTGRGAAGPAVQAENRAMADLFAGRPAILVKIHGLPATTATLRRVAERGNAASLALKARMTAKGWAVMAIADLPVYFRDRAIAWRTLVALSVDEEAKASLRKIVAWGPAAKTFAVRSHRCADMIATVVGLAPAALRQARNRKADGSWGVGDLTLITKAQIAAKGMLREIGDNAGTSPAAMTAADANYISRYLVGGHIRNACHFRIKATGFEGIRAACIVNGALMDGATFALASRMVDLLNAAASAEGRPVSFGEYVARATAAA